MLKAHVLNRLMTGRCQHKSLQLWPKFHLLFLKIASIFKKVLHLKDLACTDVSFKRRLLQNQKVTHSTDRQTMRQSDYICNPLPHAH